MKRQETITYLLISFMAFATIILTQGLFASGNIKTDPPAAMQTYIEEYRVLSAPLTVLKQESAFTSPQKEEFLSYSAKRLVSDKALLLMQENNGEIDPSKPMVALTYDDGPYSPVTERILDVMEKYNIRCTFFVVGNRIGSYWASVQRAGSLGCEIGSHSLDHSTFPNLTAEGIFRQINETDYLIWYYTEKTANLLRPPGGNHDGRTDALVGKPLIMWSLDTEDWYTRDAQATIDNILKDVDDGDIILMHDLYPSTADATEIVVPELITRGFQLVTVSEMAEAKGIAFEDGKTYSHM